MTDDKPGKTQPGRNGGTLKRGGTNPGAGRPPSVLRAQMRGSLARRIKIAETIADDTDATDSDRLKALDFLAKYGLGTTVTETDTEGNDVARVVEVPAKLARSEWVKRLAAGGSNGTNGNGSGSGNGNGHG